MNTVRRLSRSREKFLQRSTWPAPSVTLFPSCRLLPGFAFTVAPGGNSGQLISVLRGTTIANNCITARGMHGRAARGEKNVQGVGQCNAAHFNYRIAAPPGLVHRLAGLAELCRSDGEFALSRAIRGRRFLLSAGTGSSRSGYRDRR